MEQYIPKSVVLAKIEKLRNNALESFRKGNSTEEQYYIRYGVIQDILSFLDTLETKEVDLEKEWKEFLKNGDIGFKEVAKHFFELGLKIQKEEIV